MKPNHIAFLPDGNRRWAKKNNVPRAEGHRVGLEQIAPEIIRGCFAEGIHTVTLHPFSTDNWKRSDDEVNELMKTFSKMVDEMGVIAKNNRAKVVHLGSNDKLPKALLKKIVSIEAQTIKNKKHVLNLAVNYGGHDEINRAIERASKKFTDSAQLIKSIKKTGLASWLDTADQPYPNPDLIVRTAEKRLSGFMPYQSTLSEVNFYPCLWPDFTKSDLEIVLSDFSQRQRRFGA